MAASTDRRARPVIGVALKWVDLRPEVDPLSGAVHDDAHSFGCSPADQAALEWALRLAGSWSQNTGGPPEVVVVTAGPAAAEGLLRDALAAGADRAVRVELIPHAPSDEVALALGDILADAALVCCGDFSVDRGSGSVPAYLAARLGAAQALGLVHVEPGAEALRVTRRLDHGRREVLSLATGAGAPPAVLSVEGSSADLRRASLAAVLAARDELIDVVAAPAARAARTKVTRRAPYRPRARFLPPPDAALDVRGRVLSLTGALVERMPPRTVHADAVEAADLLLEQLRAWGYLE